MSCATCKFWKPQQADFGLCRRRAPGITEQGGTNWPITVGHDTCGEHVASEPYANLVSALDEERAREADRAARAVGLKGPALREPAPDLLEIVQGLKK